MTYDDALNQLTLTDPSAGLTSYTYNGLGQLLTQTDAKLKTITCSYEPTTGRLLSKTDGTGKLTESYTYYSQADKFGLLKTATRNGVTETYTYDAQGRPTSVVTAGAGKTFTTTYSYNTQQLLDIVNHPNGLSLKYEYDMVGNLTKISSLGTNGTPTGII